MTTQQDEQKTKKNWTVQTFLRVILIGVIGIASAFYVFLNETFLPMRFAYANFVTFMFLLLGLFLLLVNLFYFAWQILLSLHYRPYPNVSDADLPTCAVIIPAYNEGKQVAVALESVLASDYPADKLDIITLNDGSKDDTWEWMQKTAKESHGRIQAINFEKNGGKRKALACGFARTKAQIVVTLDSDSIATPDTIRQIVAPFMADEKIGGVAGNIRVLNIKAGLIPKMLDVSFVFGFEFLRSAQSVIRSVLCTPGALSAYRRSAIMPHMDEWVNETFWGHPANIGEDRAITNILLREGYGIVFQRSSVVYTEMPTDYNGLCKMLIRWGRSNVRENLSMAKFAFKRFDAEDDDLIGMQMNLVVQTFWMIAPIIFTAYSVFCIATDALPFIFGATFSVIFWSTLPAFVYARRHNPQDSLWSYVYGFFSFLTLFWISPYCVFTVHRSGWLTRQAPKAKVAVAAEIQMENSTLAVGAHTTGD